MVGLLSWIQNNWASAIGAIGIVGGLMFTAASFREDSRQRLVANLLAIDERHRNLWIEARQRHDLIRVFDANGDVLKQPLSVAESEFLDNVAQYYETGWRIETALNRGELGLLARDSGQFFSLPLPRAVWEATKEFRNPRFVRFVERALKNQPTAV